MPEDRQQQGNSPLCSGVIIIGAGTMGRGIAQFFLHHHLPVTLVDVKTEILASARQEIERRLIRQEEKGIVEKGFAHRCLANLISSTELTGHSGEIIIEAVVEEIEVKKRLFKVVTEAYGPKLIYASNTSSLSISEIAGATLFPERVMGIHFFNPAAVMPLVEIIKGMETDPALVEKIFHFLKRLGKTPVVVEDTPGFIVNRVARPFYNEAIKIYGEGLAEVQTIDRIMKDAGFKMGPFELQDLIGIDINFATTLSLYTAYHGDPRFRPHPIQERMVKSGRLGRKVKKGYYTYD